MKQIQSQYMRHMIYDMKFIHQGWFSDQEALDAARLVPCCVYGFILAKQRPHISMLPCDYPDALYIGQSSGDPSFDRKSKKGKGQVKYTMVKRVLAHRYQISLVRRGINKNKKYVEIVERMDADPELTLWICFVAPDINEKDLEGTRSMCLAIESCGILDYTLRWGGAPSMNGAHKQSNSRKNPGSISSKYITSVRSLPF